MRAVLTPRKRDERLARCTAIGASAARRAAAACRAAVACCASTARRIAAGCAAARCTAAVRAASATCASVGRTVAGAGLFVLTRLRHTAVSRSTRASGCALAVGSACAVVRAPLLVGAVGRVVIAGRRALAVVACPVVACTVAACAAVGVFIVPCAFGKFAVLRQAHDASPLVVQLANGAPRQTVERILAHGRAMATIGLAGLFNFSVD